VIFAASRAPRAGGAFLILRRTEMSTEAQAPALATKPRRNVPWLTLFHSQAEDVWAVSSEMILLGADADDARIEVVCFGTKQKAEEYIARFATDDDDDDDDEPDSEFVAELEKLLAQGNK
jgi:hypothetical protein